MDLFPELIDELESFEFSVIESGSVHTGSPLGGHDDCVIALAARNLKVTASRRSTILGRS